MTRTRWFQNGIRVAYLGCALAVPWQTAHAWNPFRSENGDVNDGIEALRAKDYKGALARFNQAAKSLPDHAGVHLNRGIALLKLNELGKAVSALETATDPSLKESSAKLRARAQYHLGLAHHRLAKAAAEQQQHPQAQEKYRDAIEAYKRSLRRNPGHQRAAWNLAVATQQLREQEKKQKQQEKQNQEKQNQEEQNPDKQNQDNQQDSQQDKKKPEPQNPQDDQGQKKPQQPEQSKSPQNEPSPSKDAESKPQAPQNAGAPNALPRDMRRALDALKNREKSLQREAARARAARGGRRRVNKDW